MKAVIFICGMVMCMLLASVSMAQTCTGSLGDPVVHIDFGAGTAVQGPALAPGITTYSYVTGKPNDGQYTIASSTAGMFNTWFVVNADHTGNTGGYMMVANASYSPDVFYIDTIKALCPSTTYEFAAWIMNLNQVEAATANFSLPNITFSIELTNGTVLQTYSTGSIPQTSSPTWIQYGLTFATPSNQNTVIIKMTNNAQGGNGNDILLDDITFRPCGPVIVTGFGSSASSTYNNCTANPQKDTLNANVSTGFANPTYIWQINTGTGWTNIAGATGTQYIFTQPANVGTYQYRLASAEGTNINTSTCQTFSNITTLTVTQTPGATASANGPILCQGQTLNLSATGGSSYSWVNPAGAVFSTAQNPVISNITLAQSGKYTVTASLNGCTAQASVTIGVQPQIKAKVNTDTTICLGGSAKLTASGGLSYLWTPSTGLSNDAIANPIASPTVTTTYTVLATNANCSSSAIVTVTVIQPPVISAGGNRKIIQGQSIKLAATATGSNLTYSWTPQTYLDNPYLLTPTATPPTDITYTLRVTSACTSVTDTAQIKVYKKIVVPSVFSPNADGINDTWYIVGLDAYPESILTIYNRSGQKLFTNIGGSIAWDGTYNGKALPDGVYYYIIDLKNDTPLLSGYTTIVK